MEIYIGLDIGGTKLLAASADHDGKIIRRMRKDTPQALKTGLSLLQNIVTELAGDHKIRAIGAAVGGPLDWQTGVVSPLHQPEWLDVPLKQIMGNAFGCPFYVDVDTNVAALGEYKFGGEQPDRLFYMTMSTGVGGGLLVDGKIYRGMAGEHPEVGHHAIPFQCVNPENVNCECGAPDCLEALISGNGIRRIYGKAAEKLNDAELQEIAHNLGLGLRNIACFYAPDAIVLGGGVAVGGGDKLINRAVLVMREHLKIVPVPEVRLSNLGYETALMGALAVALDGLS
ncbi:MAG: ROK family protein [bacterium]